MLMTSAFSKASVFAVHNDITPFACTLESVFKCLRLQGKQRKCLCGDGGLGENASESIGFKSKRISVS